MERWQESGFRLHRAGFLNVLWPEGDLEQVIIDLEDVATLVVGKGEHVFEMDDFARPADQQLILGDKFRRKHANAIGQALEHYLRGQIGEGGVSKLDRLVERDFVAL